MCLDGLQMDSLSCYEYFRHQIIDGREILQRDHRFVPLDELRRTLCAVLIPFEHRHMNSNEPIHIYVRFDFINIDLPFLIGLPSLKQWVQHSI